MTGQAISYQPAGSFYRPGHVLITYLTDQVMSRLTAVPVRTGSNQLGRCVTRPDGIVLPRRSGPGRSGASAARQVAQTAEPAPGNVSHPSLRLCVIEQLFSHAASSRTARVYMNKYKRKLYLNLMRETNVSFGSCKLL